MSFQSQTTFCPYLSGNSLEAPRDTAQNFSVSKILSFFLASSCWTYVQIRTLTGYFLFAQSGNLGKMLRKLMSIVNSADFLVIISFSNTKQNTQCLKNSKNFSNRSIHKNPFSFYQSNAQEHFVSMGCFYLINSCIRNIKLGKRGKACTVFLQKK